MIDFGVPFQRSALRLAFDDEGFASKFYKHLGPQHFTRPPLGWIFQTGQRYFETYSRRMTELPLRTELSKLPEQQRIAYAEEVDTLIARGPVVEDAWLREQLAEYVKFSRFMVVHADSARIFNEGRRTEAYDLVMSEMDAMRAVDFDAVDRTWLFDDFADRQRQRSTRGLSTESEALGTGISALDALTNGGVMPGEVWAVLAPAKIGKTNWLINQGFRATRVHRFPTIHVQLEGHTHTTASRYDACFSTENYTAVKRGEINPKLYAELVWEYQQLRGLLVVRTLNDWDVSMADVLAEIREIEATGMNPAVLILDYADLLRSRNKRVDSETQHQIESMRDLKRLVNQRELRCWTAMQAQRPRDGEQFRERILTSANVADAYGKVRIIDSWGSLNATVEEQQRGEMRVFWEGHRDAAVGRCWRIRNEVERMRVAVEVIGEEIPE